MTRAKPGEFRVVEARGRSMSLFVEAPDGPAESQLATMINYYSDSLIIVISLHVVFVKGALYLQYYLVFMLTVSFPNVWLLLCNWW